MIAFLLLDAGASTDTEFWINSISLGVGILGVVWGVWTFLAGRQVKRFAYSVVSDAGLSNPYKDLGEDIKIVLDDQEVDDVRLLVVRIANTGNTPIKKEDYDQSVRFDFPANDVIKCSIQDTRLIPTGKVKEVLTLNEQENSILLDPPVLNPRDQFNIKIFTRGITRPGTTVSGKIIHATASGAEQKVDMRVHGHITGGRIVETIPRAPLFTLRNLLLGLFIFILGVTAYPAASFITTFSQGNCAFGSIKLGGSSAFYQRALEEVTVYRNSCPVAFIDVVESSSASGLRDLKAGRFHIANSEIPASEILGEAESEQLKEYKMAGIVFAVVLHRELRGINNLATEQMKGLYEGKIKNWSEVGGPDLPVQLINRQETSGTYRTFAKYVLQQSKLAPAIGTKVDTTSQMVHEVASRPGAIGYVDLGSAANAEVKTITLNDIAPNPGTVMNGRYPFWAIEYVYTLAHPDALSASFIASLQRRITTNASLVALNEITSEILAKHS